MAALPPEPDVVSLRRGIRDAVRDQTRRIVVLDDDPTDVQTVHDIDVLTTWKPPDVADALLRPEPLFYVLTNSRALKRSEAVQLAEAVARALSIAGRGTGKRIDVISRGDSTLRGHYPWEVDPLTSLVGPNGPDGHLVIPAFPQGGRVTVGGVHYVLEGEDFVPVGTTDFARDPTFGFSTSYLPHWIEEKSGGRWSSRDVLQIPLAMLRAGDPKPVADVLASATSNQPIVSDAASDADLTVLAAAVLRAEARGRRFLARSAASFVKARIGLEDRPPLRGEDLRSLAAGPGIVLVGSYVSRTSEQLARVLAVDVAEAREIPVRSLLQGDGRDEVARTAAWANACLAQGRTAIVYTSRGLVTEHDHRDHVHVAATISSALSSIVVSLQHRPSWLLAKGGITASDVATRGLGVSRARVLGQVTTGVSLWELGPESRYPGLAYVVFPGNVGGPDALLDVIRSLIGER